jgi:hypothetical protein
VGVADVVVAAGELLEEDEVELGTAELVVAASTGITTK